MLSLLNIYLNGKFEINKHSGPKTWIVQEKGDPEKKFIINQYLKTNQRAKESFSLNQDVFKINQKSIIPFIRYQEYTERDKYVFIKIDYCEQGDLNSYISDNRFKSKANNDVKMKEWIMQLIEGICYLNQAKILHTKLSTYTIYIHKDQLKIDGFEFAERINSNNIINIDIEKNYGMFNCPELEKYRKINLKYHTWCIGWIIYEMTTCEWQHFKLLNETFKDWIPPSLPNPYSKSLNSLFKLMIKLSPVERPKPEKLKKIATKLFDKPIINEKQETTDSGSSMGYGAMYISTLNEKYKQNAPIIEDDLQNLNEEDEEKKDPSDESLDVNEKFEEKDMRIKEYKIKELLDGNEFFKDFVVKRNNKKYQMRHVKAARDNDQKILTKIQEINRKNEFIVHLHEYYYPLEKQQLAYIGEYFEESNLEKIMKRMNNEKKRFNEEKIFDLVYYLTSGLEFLHKHKIAHRDLNPKNIFMRNERPKIGNIALSSVLDQQIDSLEKYNPKTPLYFCGELLNRKKDAARDLFDIWSLGCIMFELIKFEPLFLVEDRKKLMDEENVKLAETEASQKLKKIYSGLLKNPADRPASHKVLDNLKDLIQKEKDLYKSL